MRTFIVICLKVIAVVAVIFVWLCCLPLIAVFTVYNGLRYGDWNAGVVSDCYEAWKETVEKYKEIWTDVN